MPRIMGTDHPNNPTKINEIMIVINTLITPSMAAEWLNKNTSNRKASTIKVQTYANDMQNGNWRQHHQGIAFYDDGVLADGQHRLMAIVRSKMSINMLVTFDVPRESAIGIDVHLARKTSDVLKITGQSEWIGINEAAIAKHLLALLGKASSATSASVVAEYGEHHKMAIKFAGGNAVTKNARFLTTAPVRAAAACAYHYHGEHEIRRFFKSLVSGIPESLDEIAVIRLRERLLQDAGALQSSADGRRKVTKLAMRAIKAFMERDTIGKLIEPSGFVYPLLGDSKTGSTNLI